jgi:hypothetical protein
MGGPARLRLLQGMYNLTFSLIQPLNWSRELLTAEIAPRTL